jgi:ribosome modulation factor
MPNDCTPPCKVAQEGDYYVVRDSKYKKQYESREKRYADMKADELNKKQVMNATTPFDSGYYAAGEGKPRSANPYLGRGKDREDWFAGWQKKQTEKTGSSSTFGNSAFQNGRMKAEQAIANAITPERQEAIRKITKEIDDLNSSIEGQTDSEKRIRLISRRNNLETERRNLKS